VLRLEEVPIPEPGGTGALVRVKAAGINPRDIGNVAGHFKRTTLPRTPVRDFAGIAVRCLESLCRYKDIVTISIWTQLERGPVTKSSIEALSR